MTAFVLRRTACGPAICRENAEERGGMSSSDTDAAVVAVSCSREHTFSKAPQTAIRLLAGLGVEGDAHHGVTVKHRTLVRRDPTALNLRQVHLIHCELFDELRTAGFTVVPGQIGENVTTRGIDLLALPTGTRLHLGSTAVVQVTGLRNPCRQLDQHQSGLTAALLGRDENGKLVRKAGIMGVVVSAGEIYPGDKISVELPAEPHVPLDRV
jgi:MOSC domain-containing protein YiiM